MGTLVQNIAQAIDDFDSIKQAIEDKGVEVDSGTPTSGYANLIKQIAGSGSGSDNATISAQMGYIY